MAAPLQIGRYVLHGEIASGGMASVHYGRLVGTGGFAKTVAIKRLHRALTRVESFKKMILEEGRLAARVRHPNVVPPLDVLSEGGELLLVMEYVHGESLSRLVRAAWANDERVPLPVAAAILSNVLHGLHAAHEAKDEAGKPLDIVHRDISPQNVIVGADGVSRVIDFGIAKAVTSEEMTTAGTIKGKVPYLAPEQLEGDPATRRTDIYAAAVVFWELLANRRLFDGKDDSEILRQIVGMEVRPPSELNPLVAGIVDDVVLRAIARDPSQRFETARAFALAIEGAVHLATSTVVGAWTERLAKDKLAERAAAIRDVEAMVADEPAAPSVKQGTMRMSAADANAARSPVSARPPPSKRPPPVPTGRPPPLPPPLPRPKTPVAERVSIPPPPAPGTAVPSARRPKTLPPPGERAAAPPMRPPAASRPVVMEPRTVIYEPPPMPEPVFVEGVRAISQEPPPPAQQVPFTPSQAPGPPAAGALRKPDVAIRNVDWLTARDDKPAPQGSAFKRFLRYLAAFLILALIVAWMFAPAIVRAWIQTGATARGLVMTIDRVDVSRRAIRLGDVKVESPDFPGATVHAGTITIGLRWLVPERITVDDAELDLEGPFSEAETKLALYRVKRGASFAEATLGIRGIEVTSGRIDWKGVMGEGTSALVENITVEMNKNPVRALGDDYHLTAPLFTMKLSGANAGPWQLDVDRQGILVRTVVHFDPTGSYPATVSRTVVDDGSATFALEVPPRSLADLHLPAAFVGRQLTDKTKLEAHGEIQIVAVQQATTRGAEAGAGAKADASASADAGASASAGRDGGTSASGAGATGAGAMIRSVSGHLILGAWGLAVFPGGPPIDVSLDLPMAGDAARVMPIAGALSIAPTDPTGGPSAPATSAPMTGTLDLGKGATRLEMSGKSAALVCAKPGPTAPGAPPPPPAAAGGAKTTGLTITVGVTLDDYAGAKVGFVPAGTCSPKLR